MICVHSHLALDWKGPWVEPNKHSCTSKRMIKMMMIRHTLRLTTSRSVQTAVFSCRKRKTTSGEVNKLIRKVRVRAVPDSMLLFKFIFLFLQWSSRGKGGHLISIGVCFCSSTMHSAVFTWISFHLWIIQALALPHPSPHSGVIDAILPLSPLSPLGPAFPGIPATPFSPEREQVRDEAFGNNQNISRNNLSCP